MSKNSAVISRAVVRCQKISPLCMLTWLGSAEKYPQQGKLRMGPTPESCQTPGRELSCRAPCLQAGQGARLGLTGCCNRTKSWGCGSLQQGAGIPAFTFTSVHMVLNSSDGMTCYEVPQTSQAVLGLRLPALSLAAAELFSIWERPPLLCCSCLDIQTCIIWIGHTKSNSVFCLPGKREAHLDDLKA